MPDQKSPSSLVHQRLKPRRTRVKTGCLSCRLRRKKCDELKPVCLGCRRNHLICSQESDPHAKGASLHDKQCEPFSNVAPDRTTLKLRASSGLLSLSGMLGSLSFTHPASRILFEHYVLETANLLSIYRGAQNPFITCVMPLAHSDSMIMDSVLALSGAHLCHTRHGADMDSASALHYTLTLRQLKHELTRANSGVPSDPVRLLLTIMLLSTTEAVSGNSQGATFHHLRAGDHFIPSILALDPNHGDQEVRAFLLETYAYMVSVANITVNMQPIYPALAINSCITGLERFQDCKASGMMFGHARSLITLIPSICTLGYSRILEESAGEYSIESVACYKALLSKIEEWQEPSINESMGSNTNELIQATKVYKEAILIFLHAAFYASNVTDPKLLALVDTSINRIYPNIEFEADSTVLPVMLWPCMILGSCLREHTQRQYLRKKMLEGPFNMKVVLNSVQLLGWLWEDTALDAYGPYGLGYIMKKYGVIHSMS